MSKVCFCSIRLCVEYYSAGILSCLSPEDLWSIVVPEGPSHSEEMELSWDTPAAIRHWLEVALGARGSSTPRHLQEKVETKDDCAKVSRCEA